MFFVLVSRFFSKVTRFSNGKSCLMFTFSWIESEFSQRVRKTDTFYIDVEI